jgi:hypothetical protein
MCYCQAETNNHILTECNFSKAVWDKIVLDLQLHLVVLPFQKGGVSEWLQAVCRVPGKKQQRKMAGVILFYWWNLWKEHNHHAFDQKEMSFLQVVDLIKQDINLFIRALAVDC